MEAVAAGAQPMMPVLLYLLVERIPGVVVVTLVVAVGRGWASSDVILINELRGKRSVKMVMGWEIINSIFKTCQMFRIHLQHICNSFQTEWWTLRRPDFDSWDQICKKCFTRPVLFSHLLNRVGKVFSWSRATCKYGVEVMVFQYLMLEYFERR
jgi:hypothetical protein